MNAKSALSLIASIAASAAAGATEMFPFVPSYDSPDNVVSMSHLLPAPAGRDGRIRVADGHFVNDKGRVRLNATNLTGPANFPTHEEAERLAARLARFGINCVRLHYFDDEYGTFMLPKEQGILPLNPKSKREFDPERRDRQDYLIAQFKKRGIYVNVNLHVARNLGEADGIPPGTFNKNKGFNQFYPPLVKLQKEYAKGLLSHVNPYTGMSYLKDPAVAVVELNNEEALWRLYRSGGLDSRDDVYGKCIKKLWSDWLVKKYGTTEKARQAWKLAEKPLPFLDKFRIENGDYPLVHSKRSRAPEAMKRDFYQFVTDVEHDYWTGMRAYLKNDLGLEAPVAATQLGYSTPFLQAEMDYVDNHAYWCHPSVKTDWKIGNKAMVNNSASCIGRLAAQRVLGKPYTISEYNHPYPNFYGAEGQPMLRAYGALHGWDGVFEYSYNNRQNAEPDHNEYFFSMAARTDVLAHMPACAAMYLRGDVKESASPYVANLPYNEYFDRFVNKGPIAQGIVSATDGKVPQELCLMRKTAVDLSGKSKAAGGVLPEKDQKVFVSDTGELLLNGEVEGAGYWTVNTPNTKVFSGFTKGRTFDLGGVKLKVGETRLGWATISLTSHDATGFGEGGRPARILLTATGLCHNGGAKFTHEGDSVHCRGKDWGTGKTVNEGIAAAVTLPSMASATKCWALDERGERKAEVPVTADAGGRAAIAIGPGYRTVWYEIAVGK
ncbi:MAG: hypothetical protein J6T51_02610 [Kiritimatiellae bacterium]|nr:hypothetical protein [Kiritimatiellia bacterium]